MGNASELLEKLQSREEMDARKTNGREFGWIKGSSNVMKWKDGINPIRLVGNFYEVHTHQLSPSPDYGRPGVAEQSCFRGRGALPFEVVCTNWNLKEERYHTVNTCPFCLLSDRARTALRIDDISDEEKKVFQGIKDTCRPYKQIMWNLIDRSAPYYYRVRDGKDIEEVGLKYAKLSFSMFNDIKGIIEQVGMDITDPDTGIDLIVNRTKNNGKIKYSVQPALLKGSVKVTPLTDEERGWTPWDFVEIYDKPYELEAFKDKMRPEFRGLLLQSDEEFDNMINSRSAGGSHTPARGTPAGNADPSGHAGDDGDDESKKNIFSTDDDDDLPPF